MKNIVEVREELSIVFQDLKNGTLEHKVASELNNCAGKIINSLKIELEYYSLRKEHPVISFFENK